MTLGIVLIDAWVIIGYRNHKIKKWRNNNDTNIGQKRFDSECA